MPGLLKLVVLLLLAAVVWYAIKTTRRLNDAERRLRRRSRTGPVPAAAHDLVACPECGAYVEPGSAASCGRPRCPHR